MDKGPVQGQHVDTIDKRMCQSPCENSIRKSAACDSYPPSPLVSPINKMGSVESVVDEEISGSVTMSDPTTRNGECSLHAPSFDADLKSQFVNGMRDINNSSTLQSLPVQNRCK